MVVGRIRERDCRSGHYMLFTVILLKDGVRVVVSIIRERDLVHGRKW